MNKRDGWIKVSNTYFPNHSSFFRLTKIEDYRQNREKEEPLLPEESENSMAAAGVSNGWKRNHSYLKLVEKWDLEHLSNEDILSIFQNWLLGWTEKRKSTKYYNYQYADLTKKIPSEIKKILIIKFREEWAIKQLSSTFNLNDVVWRAII